MSKQLSLHTVCGKVTKLHKLKPLIMRTKYSQFLSVLLIYITTTMQCTRQMVEMFIAETKTNCEVLKPRCIGYDGTT